MRMPQHTQRTLKGVIPPKKTEPNGLLEAFRRLREFVQRYPGLGEEVMEMRRQQQEEELLKNGHLTHDRNQLYSGHHVRTITAM